MFRELSQLFKAVPITCTMLFVSGLVWAADNALAQRLQISYPAAQVALGAESQIGLWDGAWWTILTTSLHHGDGIHLLMNAGALWWLGRLLETRMGSWRYAAFSLFGAAVAGAFQTFWGPYVGLSGMLYAQFGLIWAWRRWDAWLQTYVRDDNIQWGVIWLFLCLILTWYGLLRIGNAAHFSGCIYGYVTGMVYFGSSRARVWKPVFLTAHAGLIPMFFFLSHPFWDGNYHWRRGDLAKTPQEQEFHYLNATRYDPSLDGPWYNLALLAAKGNRMQEAWEWSLNCLKHNPTYTEAIKLARDIGASFPNRLERERARAKLREILGEDSAAWEKELLAEVALDEVVPNERRPKRISKSGPQTNATEEESAEVEVQRIPFQLPPRALDEIIRPDRKMPAPNPNTPGSAEEGRSA